MIDVNQGHHLNLDKVLASTRPVLDKVKSISVIDNRAICFNLKEWDILNGMAQSAWRKRL